MKNNQQGFALLSTLAVAGFAATVIGISYRLLDNRVEWMKIVRVQQRMDLLEAGVLNAAKSFGAMKMTATANKGSSFQQCMTGKGCYASSSFTNIVLQDGAGATLSGKFGLNGEVCTRDCPFEVATEVQIACDNAAPSCISPSEIITRYEIRKVGRSITERAFKPIAGQVSMSTFSCPPDQYIHAITDDGQIQCSPAEASPYKDGCPDKTAAVGISDEGMLSCSEVTNYCAQGIGFALVLDVSGSMLFNNKIKDARNVLKKLVKKFKLAKDQSSLVTFSNTGSLVQGLSGDFPKIETLIDKIPAVGGTNMTDGLNKAAQSIARHKGGPKLMLFVSDGYNNMSLSDPVAAAQAIKQSGVRIISIGFSKDADKNTLRRIASSPEDFFSADDAKELDRAFDQITKVVCRK